MSEQTSYLLVDIGNTNIKYAQYSIEKGIGPVRIANSSNELAGMLGHNRQVMLSCVARDQQVAIWETLCREHNTPLFVAKTQAKTLGMQCAYDNYHTLGVDRWLAILAGRHLSQKAFVTISIGTAMTCDLVIEQQHIGGWILPGFSLMREGLISNTAKVFSDEAIPNELAFGKSTPDCVNLGCLAAVQGAVKMATEMLKSYSADFDIFITGGGQSLVKQIATPQYRFEDNLVITGLSLLVEQ